MTTQSDTSLAAERESLAQERAAQGTGSQPRFRTRYRSEIMPAMQQEFGYSNVMQIPGLTKMVVNMGVGEAARDAKVINQGGRAGTTGGIVTQEAAIHISNVMLVAGKGTTRIGFKRVEVEKRRADGSTYKAERSVRIARKTGEEI